MSSVISESIVSLAEAAATKAERRMKRNADEVSKCEREIAVIGNRAKRLKTENEQLSLVTSLRKEGSFAWNKLISTNDKWKKENVLAVFLSGKIPPAMREARWRQEAPASIRDDRDILLARLCYNKEFAQHYRYYSPRREAVPFCIPEPLRKDEEIVVASVRAYPEVLLQAHLLPALHLDDIHVVRAYLQSERLTKVTDRETRSRVTGLLGQFSVGVRGNAALMLEACEHSNTVCDHFAESLFDNGSFAQMLVEATMAPPNHTMRRFSRQVRENRKLVLALVQKNGACLQDASVSLRGDYEIVRAACQSRPRALMYSANPARQTLVRDRKFVLDIFSRLKISQNRPFGRHSELFAMLHSVLKQDREIVVAAHRAKCLEFSDLPELTRNRAFWMYVIEKDCSFWFGLPAQFEGDPRFVRAIECFDNNATLVRAIFRQLPFLAEERGVWSAIISCAMKESLVDLIREFAPAHIRGDKELMSICWCDDGLMTVLSPELQQDRDIVRKAIEASPYAFRLISDSVQRMYPDLVANALHKLPDRIGPGFHADESVADMVAESLWTNLDVCKAWFVIGGDFHSRFPEFMKDSVEFGLLVAEHCEDTDEFEDGTSENLRSDKTFMLKAVEYDGWHYLSSSGALRRDFDLAVAAFSREDAEVLVQIFIESAVDHDEDLIFLNTVLQKAKAKVEAHKGFTEAFVYGMTDFAGSGCHLSMLVHDKETSSALKRSIAAYLGVPIGKELRRLRLTTENLSGIPCPCRCCCGWP